MEPSITNIHLDGTSAKYFNRNFQISLQLNEVRQVLSRAQTKEEIEMAEDYLMVFLILLGSDNIYEAELSKLTQEYSIKLANLTSNEEELKRKKRLCMRNFALLMQLADRQGYTIVREGEFQFSDYVPQPSI